MKVKPQNFMTAKVISGSLLLITILAGARWILPEPGTTPRRTKAVVIPDGELPLNDATRTPEVQEAFGKAKVWEYEGKRVADLRSIKPRIVRSVMPPTKTFKSMFARARRLAMRYGVALPANVRLTPEDWAYLKQIYEETTQHCVDLGIERIRKRNQIWESAKWTKIESLQKERRLRNEAKKENAIFRIKGTDEGKFFASYTRKKSPELWAYEDRADAFWVAYLSEFLLLVAKRNRL